MMYGCLPGSGFDKVKTQNKINEMNNNNYDGGKNKRKEVR